MKVTTILEKFLKSLNCSIANVVFFKTVMIGKKCKQVDTADRIPYHTYTCCKYLASGNGGNGNGTRKLKRKSERIDFQNRRV